MGMTSGSQFLPRVRVPSRAMPATVTLYVAPGSSPMKLAVTLGLVKTRGLQVGQPCLRSVNTYCRAREAERCNQGRAAARGGDRLLHARRVSHHYAMLGQAGRQHRCVLLQPPTWGNARAGKVLAVAVPVVRPVGFVESKWTLMGVVNWSMLRPGVRLPALVTPSTVTLYCGRGGQCRLSIKARATHARASQASCLAGRRLALQLRPDLCAGVKAGQRRGQAAAGEGQHGAAGAAAAGLANREDVLQRYSVEHVDMQLAASTMRQTQLPWAWRMPNPAGTHAKRTFVNARWGSVAVAEPVVGPVASARVRYSDGSGGVVSCSWLSPRVRLPSRLMPVTVTLYCKARGAAWSQLAVLRRTGLLLHCDCATPLCDAPSPWCWAPGR